MLDLASIIFLSATIIAVGAGTNEAQTTIENFRDQMVEAQYRYQGVKLLIIVLTNLSSYLYLEIVSK